MSQLCNNEISLCHVDTHPDVNRDAVVLACHHGFDVLQLIIPDVGEDIVQVAAQAQNTMKTLAASTGTKERRRAALSTAKVAVYALAWRPARLCLLGRLEVVKHVQVFALRSNGHPGVWAFQALVPFHTQQKQHVASTQDIAVTQLAL